MFEAADQLFDAGEIDQCIEQATRNLKYVTAILRAPAQLITRVQ